MGTDELIQSVDRKLELLLMGKDELKKAIFGENGEGGLSHDVHEIRSVLVGDPEFKKQGLIEIVQKHDELFNKMKNMTSFGIGMTSIGIAAGTVVTWVFHNAHLIKKFFS